MIGFGSLHARSALIRSPIMTFNQKNREKNSKVNIEVRFAGGVNKRAYKSVASALVGRSVRDDHGLLDVAVHAKVLAQTFVRGVVGQPADEQLRPGGVLLLDAGGGPAPVRRNQGQCVGRVRCHLHQHYAATFGCAGCGRCHELGRRMRNRGAFALWFSLLTLDSSGRHLENFDGFYGDRRHAAQKKGGTLGC